jgi:hypothetical protein
MQGQRHMQSNIQPALPATCINAVQRDLAPSGRLPERGVVIARSEATKQSSRTACWIASLRSQ